MIVFLSFSDSCGALVVDTVVFSLTRAGALETGPLRR